MNIMSIPSRPTTSPLVSTTSLLTFPLIVANVTPSRVDALSKALLSSLYTEWHTMTSKLIILHFDLEKPPHDVVRRAAECANVSVEAWMAIIVKSEFAVVMTEGRVCVIDAHQSVEIWKAPGEISSSVASDTLALAPYLSKEISTSKLATQQSLQSSIASARARAERRLRVSTSLAAAPQLTSKPIAPPNPAPPFITRDIDQETIDTNTMFAEIEIKRASWTNDDELTPPPTCTTFSPYALPPPTNPSPWPLFGGPHSRFTGFPAPLSAPGQTGINSRPSSRSSAPMHFRSNSSYSATSTTSSDSASPATPKTHSNSIEAASMDNKPRWMSLHAQSTILASPPSSVLQSRLNGNNRLVIERWNSAIFDTDPADAQLVRPLSPINKTEPVIPRPAFEARKEVQRYIYQGGVSAVLTGGVMLSAKTCDRVHKWNLAPRHRNVGVSITQPIL